jgi:hypothetical protein
LIKPFLRRLIAAVPLILACTAANLPAQSRPSGKLTASAIEIYPAGSGEIKLPPEFQMAIYENLISRVEKTARFLQVFREGDVRTGGVPNLVVMHEELRDFKAGSERLRDVTTVAGATTIRLRLQISSRDGRILLDREVKGKVRFYGANLRATDDLAKDVTKLIRENFDVPWTSTKPAAGPPR